MMLTGNNFVLYELGPGKKEANKVFEHFAKKLDFTDEAKPKL